MRVIPPLAIDDSRLTDSSVSEPDTGEAVYNALTTYSVDQRVISTSTHRTYQSLSNSNTGNPLPVYPATLTNYWIDVGPTNKWAMFDLLRNTGTTVASPLTVVITPGQRIDSIALVGLVATSVQIIVTVDAAIVFDQTTTLSTRVVTDWYEYFFSPFTYREAVANFSLPPYTNGVITINIVNATGNVTCGGVVIGQSVYLGEALVDAQNDATNLSTIERSTDGTTVLVQRRSVPKTLQQVRFGKAIVNRLIRVRTDLNAVPALWSALDDQEAAYFEPMLILGVYKRFTVNMDLPDHGLLELELEEV